MRQGEKRFSNDCVGSGRPKREFLYADDLANACVHLMNIDATLFYQNRNPQCSHVNVGSGQELSISELAELVSQVVGFRGEIVFDTSKPDGTPQKRLDSSVVHKLGGSQRLVLKKAFGLPTRTSKNVTEQKAMSQKVALITGITGQDGSYLLNSCWTKVTWFTG